MLNKVRIIDADGRITVSTLAFSQIAELIRGLDKAAKDTFWSGKDSVDLPDGLNVKLVGRA